MPGAPSDTDLLLRIARFVAAAGARWHRASLDGGDRLPAGPALLVGNHGLFGLETPVFFWLLYRSTGRYPIGLADRRVFGRLGGALERVGGVLGSPEAACDLLRAGHLVVCYPGGADEVFKAPQDRYRLAWSDRCGFARVAIRCGVPVIPFAGLGVDDSFVNFGHLPGVRRRLGRYAAPIALGLGPVPLPVRFRFRLAPPVQPPREPSEAERFKAVVQRSVEDLLADAHQQAPLPSRLATDVA